MEKGFSVYKCKLVKEAQIDYVGTISHPDDVYTATKKIGFTEFAEEILGAFMTDSKGRIISYHEISHGDLNSSIVHPRELYKRAVISNASAIILIHNHPSGDISPSDEDISTTKRLMEAGDIIGIPILDHVIIGHNSDYFSMKANDLL